MRWVWLLWMISACRPAPIQTWVFLNVDPSFVPDAEDLRLTITSDGEEVAQRTDPVDRSTPRIANLFLVPEAGDVNRSFEIHAELLDGDIVVANLRVGGGYELGDPRIINAFFETDDPCLRLGDCGTGRTCLSGRCVGACFETTTEEEEGARQRPRCGECGRCASGSCQPLATGAACGCAGDACQAGVCRPGTDVSRVFLGESYAYAQTSRGRWAWGAARTRQTTLREATDAPVRLSDPALESTLEFALAEDFGCARWIRRGPTHGRSCWGWADDNRFAMGEVSGTRDPIEMLDDPSDPFVSIKAGERYQCGLRASGILQCAGQNDSGQLGVPTSTEQLGTWVTPMGTYRTFDIGGSSTCAIGEEGIFCWGVSTVGRARSSTPECIPGVDGGCAQGLTAVAVGDGAACALDADGVASCWGINTGGLLGVIGPDIVPAATRVDTEVRFRSLSASGRAFCGISLEGGLYCWGAGSSVLGLEDEDVDRPTRVEVDPNDRWQQVVRGEGFTCAINENDHLYCWGTNQGRGPAGSRFAGRLGLGLGTDPDAPVSVPTPRRVCFESAP